ncbi:MAG: UbiH/UbiF/VisC/COQ6 family ubiquinone biosynthesis hydroxylase [Gammaproteobacteria bacterium]
MNKKSQIDAYDVVIVGAGMVGATLACALGDRALRVAVIEARQPALEWPKDSVDLRVSAITAASQKVFSSLKAWQMMTQRGVSPFREMHVWDATGPGSIHFNSEDIGTSELGHIIENRVIQAAMVKQMETFDTVDLLCPVKLEAINYREKNATIELENHGEISARLVVGADGGQSKVRQLAGIKTKGWPYHQKAVVTMVETEQSHRETAWQRFMPTGPLAFLPLRDGKSSIVWSTTHDEADELLAVAEVEFCSRLGSALDHKLGRILECGQRAAFPLKLQHTLAYVDHRLALIGDAAHTIHPLAGQGVNLGLLDAASLAEVILNAVEQGKDFGRLPVLRRYERWRKGDNLMMMAAMDGFKRLFGSPYAPVRWARNMGLSMTNAATPVKNHMIKHAMGMRGDLPRLAS